MTPTDTWVEELNTITLQVNGTRFFLVSEYYSVWVNLTNWGESYQYEIPLSLGFYTATITNLPSGFYDGVDITATINSTGMIPIFAESSTTFAGYNITVDGVIPIINISTIFVSDEINGTIEMKTLDPSATPVFYVWLKVYDNATFYSGILTADIKVGGTLFNLVDGSALIAPDYMIATIDVSLITSDKLRLTEVMLDFGLVNARDLATNDAIPQIANASSLLLIDTTKPHIEDWSTFKISGLEYDGDPIELEAGQYLEIEIEAFDDDGASGIMWVRIYYEVEGEATGILPSGLVDLDDLDYIELAKTGDKYFGVLTDEDQVGFAAGQEVSLILVVSDFDENVYRSDVDDGIIIELEFTRELPVMSMIILAGAFAAFMGALVFAIIFRRKRAVIIDLDVKMKKQKK